MRWERHITCTVSSNFLAYVTFDSFKYEVQMESKPKPRSQRDRCRLVSSVTGCSSVFVVVISIVFGLRLVQAASDAV